MARLRAIVTAVLVSLAAACATTTDSDGTEETADGFVVLVGDTSGDAMDAAAWGEVTHVGGCVGLIMDGLKYVVVWPKGTVAAGAGLKLPNEDDVQIGAMVSGGGGYLTPPLPSGLPVIPEDCAGSTDEVLVLDEVALDDR